ncbi:MAG: ELM1/GtrOC1 family putative glycosyltransferase [bacterium]
MGEEKKIGKAKRRVLIVSDGKRGHVHQTEGVVRKLPNSIGKKLEIRMSKPYYLFLVAMSCLARRFNFSQPLILFWIQRVTETKVANLIKFSPEIIISAGSITHPVTFLLGRIWDAKTVICMRPSLLSNDDFDLVIAPRHDQRRCLGDNVIYTMGATSDISEGFIFAEAVTLYAKLKTDVKRPFGLLVGGDSSLNFISAEMAGSMMDEILKACSDFGLSLLTTTSRRTAPAAEKAIRGRLEGSPANAYTLFASESPDNPVPGIIGLCEIVIVTEDSVSMVSEIISGGKYAIVVKVGRKKNRNKFEGLFQDLMDEQYITYTDIKDLNKSISDALRKSKRGFKALDESKKVAIEIERLFFGNGSGTGVIQE